MSMDNWDPRRDDYKDANINSYTKGPGRNMPVSRGSKGKRVQLFVTGIPNEITEDGLKNLFSRVGEVISVSKKASKKPNAPDTFGFIEMENAIAAEKAIQEFNNFKIDRFTLRVKVSNNEQDKRRNNTFLQEDSVFGLGDNDAGSDTDPILSPWSSTLQPNGFSGHNGMAGSMGAGRGQKLADLSAASNRTLLPTPALSPIRPPSNNLSVSVNEPLNSVYGVGRGFYKPQQQGPDYDRGWGRQRGSWRGGPRGGHRGRGNQHNYHNNNQGYHGRGRGHQYNNYHDGQDHYGRGGYRQSYGRGQPNMPFQQPPPHLVYGMPMLDPYAYSMMAAGAASQHLLQPAYNTMMPMATPMINMADTQQPPTNQPMPTPSTRKAVQQVTNECSVCGSMGSLRCSRCKQPYCSPTCQKQDWPDHKDICKAIQKENEATKDFSEQFDVSVGDELIPKVKELMEKATGDKVEITRKPRKSASQSHKERRSQQSPASGSERNGRDQSNRKQDTDGKKDKGCLNCGSISHRRKDCTEPEGVNKNCFNCGDMGHLSRDCPSKYGRRPDSRQNSSMSTPAPNRDVSMVTNGGIAPRTLPSFTPPAKKTTLPQEGLSLYQECNVVITEVQNPSCIWVQKSCQETLLQLQELMLAMLEKFSVIPCDVKSATIGDYYGCQFSEDNGWYRARILSTQGKTITVQYVDFGNTEETTVDKLRQLNDAMKTTATQAIKVSLEGVEPSSGSEWDVPVAKWHAYLEPNQEYKLTGHRKVGSVGSGTVYEVVMKNSQGESMAQNLLAAGLAKSMSSKQPGAYSNSENATSADGEQVGPLMVRTLPHMRTTLKVGQAVTVLMTELTAPDSFHLQLLTEDNIQAFSGFITELNQVYSQNTDKRYSPFVVGELVASRFTGDEDWYRGEVTEITRYNAGVLFLDYGNFEQVTFDKLRKAEAMCATVPLQAVKCSLSGLRSPKSGHWSAEVMEICKSIENKPLNAKIIEIQSDTVCVELSQITGESILEQIQQVMGPAGDAASVQTAPVPSTPVPAPKSPAQAPVSPAPKSPAPATVSSAPSPKSAPPTAVSSAPAPKSPAQVSAPIPASVEQSAGPVCIAAMQLPQIGEPVEVVITNITSTGQFYLQLGDEVSKLNNMWLELNEFYTSVEPHEATVGEFVAAQFTVGETTLWYRAKVVDKTSSGQYTAFFIDYGNTDNVDKSGIAKLDANFAALPSQALTCKLANCQDTEDGKVLAEFHKYQDVLSMARVIDFSDGVYSVELSQPDGSSINEIVRSVAMVTKETAKGSNQNEMPQLMSEKVVPEVASSAPTLRPSELPVDGSMAMGLVVHIEALSKFYVHIMDDLLQEHLTALLTLNKVCENDSNVYTAAEHEHISAKFTADSSWYRAKVIRKCDTGLEVFFVDFGNMDIVPVENVRKPCKELDKVPVLAVRCTLAGSEHLDCTDKLQDFNSILNNYVKIKVLDKTVDAGYSVELFLNNEEATSVNQVLKLDVPQAPAPAAVGTSERSPSPAGDGGRSLVPTATSASPVTHNETAAPTRPQLPHVPVEALTVGSLISAGPLLIHSVNDFYIQRADEASQQIVVQIFVHLTNLYKDSTEGHGPAVGEFVAVMYNDGTGDLWYRAVVTDNLSDGQFALHLIDFGNDIQIHSDKIRKLDEQFFSYPQQAYQCRLHGFELDTEATKTEFSKMALDKEMVMNVVEAGSVYSVELASPSGEDVATHLRTTVGTASASPCTDLVDQLPPCQMTAKEALPRKKSTSPRTGGERKVVFAQTVPQSKPVTDNLTVVITSVVRPNLFHCQVFQDDQTNLRELKLLSDSMKLECEGSEDAGDEHAWEVGELCCAKFPEDGEWYRGAVLEIFPDHTVKVAYVDFGNTSEVSTSQLRSVTLEYTTLPRLAFKCSLHGVSPVGGSWSQNAVVKMMEYQDRPVHARVVAVNSDVYELDLETAEGENLAHQLIQAGLATKPSTAQDTPKAGEVEMLQEQNKLLQQQITEMQAMMAKVLKQTQ